MNEIFHHLIRNYTRCFMPMHNNDRISIFTATSYLNAMKNILHDLMRFFIYFLPACLLVCFVRSACHVHVYFIFFLCIYFVNLFYCHLVLLPPSVLFVMCRVKTHVHYSHAAYISIHTDAVDAVVASLFNYI